MSTCSCVHIYRSSSHHQVSFLLRNSWFQNKTHSPSPEAFNSSSAWNGASAALPPLGAARWLARPCAGLAQAVAAAESSVECRGPTMSRKHHFALVFRHFCLMLPSLAVVPESCGDRRWHQCPLVDDCSTDILYAWPVVGFCINIIYCTQCFSEIQLQDWDPFIYG